MHISIKENLVCWRLKNRNNYKHLEQQQGTMSLMHLIHPDDRFLTVCKKPIPTRIDEPTVHCSTVYTGYHAKDRDVGGSYAEHWGGVPRRCSKCFPERNETE